MPRYLLLSVLFALSVPAQDAEYWPLAPGNQWIYQASLGEPFTVEVPRWETVGGNNYAVVRGLPGAGELLLRQAGGRLLLYDRQAREEKTYVDFTAAPRVSTPTTAHPCNRSVTIANANAAEKLPLGEFNGLIDVRYGGAVCADAGLNQDLFLPYIGLLRRTETSFTGPRVYDLVYARISGVVMVSAPETGFAVHAGAARGGWLVRMTLRHQAEAPLRLDFASGQMFDVAVKNEKGEEVYRWSADKSFAQALEALEVTGEKNWTTRIPQPKAPGRYVIEAWLTTRNGIAYRASTTARLGEE